MITIEAPYPDIEVMLILPEPELGNTRATTSSVQTKRMMDQTVETYINKRTQKVFGYHFIIPKLKALEILNIMRAYAGAKIRYKSSEQTVVGYLTKNPTELDIQHRAVSQGSVEEVDLQLIIEEA